MTGFAIAVVVVLACVLPVLGVMEVAHRRWLRAQDDDGR